MSSANSSAPGGSLQDKLQRLAPSSGSSRAFLLVVDGERAGRLHLLGDQDTLIGRGGEADIVVADASVSTEHARVVRREDGFYLEDLQSRNGTLINGVLIRERKLRKKDRIEVGETTLVFLEEGAAETTLTIAVPRQAEGIAVPTSHELEPRREAQRAIERPQEQEEENPVFDLVRKLVLVARLLKRHALVLGVFPVVGLVLGAVSAKLMPPPQLAAAAVRLSQDKVVLDKNQWGPQEGPAFFLEPEKNFADAELVRASLAATGADTSDGAVGQALRGLAIERDYKLPSGVYVARFTQPAGSGGVAFSSVIFLENYLDAYLQSEVDKSIRRFKSEAGFIDTKLKDVEEELHGLETELLAFRKKHIDSLPEQAQAVMTGKIALAQRRDSLDVDVERLRMEVASLQRQLKETDSVITRRVTDLKPLQDKLSAKKIALAELKSRGFTDDHPEVRQLTQQINVLEADMQSKLNSDVTDLERTVDPRRQELSQQVAMKKGELRSAESAAAKVGQQLANAAGKAAVVPEVLATIGRLTRRQESLQRLQAQLFEKHREKLVEIDLETANVRSRYEIVSPAKLQSPFTKRFLGIRFGGGLMLGLTIALLIVGWLELRRFLRQHPELLAK